MKMLVMQLKLKLDAITHDSQKRELTASLKPEALLPTQDTFFWMLFLTLHKILSGEII